MIPQDDDRTGEDRSSIQEAEARALLETWAAFKWPTYAEYVTYRTMYPALLERRSADTVRVLESLLADLASLRQHVEELDRENSRLANRCDLEVRVARELDEQIASLRAERAQLQKDLADSRVNHIDANRRNRAAEARAEHAEQERDAAKEAMTALAAASSSYRERAEAAEAALSRLEQEQGKK